jgi:REP element-mobilizing transposase RayT
MFLLRPSETINGILEYCLAEAAARFKIKVIAFTVMSNHYHGVFYDPDAKLPKFLEHFHKMVAKAVNGHHKRWENLWSSEETCVTRLITLDDVFDKVVYVLMNPVKAHLVDSVAHWPGASSWNRMGRAPKVVKRPAVYFRKDGVMPATAKLVVTAPPGLKGETAAEWIKRVRREVHLREEVARNERRSKHISLVGRKAVMATSPFAAPKTDAPRRRLRPALACKEKERMKQERAILKGFRASYRSTLVLLIARLPKGDLKAAPRIEFPAGTWRWRELGIRCERLRPAA